MLAQGVQFWKIPWMDDAGWNIPFIQNTMPVHRFDQICRYLHFVDNKKLVPKGHHKWNPLQPAKDPSFHDQDVGGILTGIYIGAVYHSG
jgi:hypothetical protein